MAVPQEESLPPTANVKVISQLRNRKFMEKSKEIKLMKENERNMIYLRLKGPQFTTAMQGWSYARGRTTAVFNSHNITSPNVH